MFGRKMEFFEWLLTNARRVGCLLTLPVASAVILWSMTVSRQMTVPQYRYPNARTGMGR